jgi:hypothetical protein
VFVLYLLSLPWHFFEIYGGYEWYLYLISFIFGVLRIYILFLQSFQSKLSFSCKEIVALSCSWCKTAYHNKESCFNLQKIGEECNLGKSTRGTLATTCQCAWGWSRPTDAYASLHMQRLRLHIGKQFNIKWKISIFCYMPTFLIGWATVSFSGKTKLYKVSQSISQSVSLQSVWISKII